MVEKTEKKDKDEALDERDPVLFQHDPIGRSADQVNADHVDEHNTLPAND